MEGLHPALGNSELLQDLGRRSVLHLAMFAQFADQPLADNSQHAPGKFHRCYTDRQDTDQCFRRVLASSPNADTLRQGLRKAKMQSLQQEGIVLVAKGVTSLPELMRVLKQ